MFRAFHQMFASTLFHVTQLKNVHYKLSALFELASNALLTQVTFHCFLPISISLFTHKWRFNHPPPHKAFLTSFFPKHSQSCFTPIATNGNQCASDLNFYLTAFKGRAHTEKKFYLKEGRRGEEPQSFTQYRIDW